MKLAATVIMDASMLLELLFVLHHHVEVHYKDEVHFSDDVGERRDQRYPIFFDGILSFIDGEVLDKVIHGLLSDTIALQTYQKSRQLDVILFLS